MLGKDSIGRTSNKRPLETPPVIAPHLPEEMPLDLLDSYSDDEAPVAPKRPRIRLLPPAEAAVSPPLSPVSDHDTVGKNGGLLFDEVAAQCAQLNDEYEAAAVATAQRAHPDDMPSMQQLLTLLSNYSVPFEAVYNAATKLHMALYMAQYRYGLAAALLSDDQCFSILYNCLKKHQYYPNMQIRLLHILVALLEESKPDSAHATFFRNKQRLTLVIGLIDGNEAHRERSSLAAFFVDKLLCPYRAHSIQPDSDLIRAAFELNVGTHLINFLQQSRMETPRNAVGAARALAIVARYHESTKQAIHAHPTLGTTIKTAFAEAHTVMTPFPEFASRLQFWSDLLAQIGLASSSL